MHQKTVYFRAPDAKFLLPWERRHPSQILPLSVASLPRSSPRSSAHPDFRIPRKMSSYGPAYTIIFLHMPSDYLLCQPLLSVEQSSNIASIRSTSKPSFFFLPRSRFENLIIRAESFDLMSVARLTSNCNKRPKKITISQFIVNVCLQ